MSIIFNYVGKMIIKLLLIPNPNEFLLLNVGSWTYITKVNEDTWGCLGGVFAFVEFPILAEAKGWLLPLSGRALTQRE